MQVNGMLLNGKIVFVGSFIPKKDRSPVNPSDTFTNVYVKNLEETVDDAGLREMFSKFGEISSCVVMKDGEGKSKGFGFLNFSDHTHAAAAVEEMEGKVFGEKVGVLVAVYRFV